MTLCFSYFYNSSFIFIKVKDKEVKVGEVVQKELRECERDRKTDQIRVLEVLYLVERRVQGCKCGWTIQKKRFIFCFFFH